MKVNIMYPIKCTSCRYYTYNRIVDSYYCSKGKYNDVSQLRQVEYFNKMLNCKNNNYENL